MRNCFLAAAALFFGAITPGFASVALPEPVSEVTCGFGQVFGPDVGNPYTTVAGATTCSNQHAAASIGIGPMGAGISANAQSISANPKTDPVYNADVTASLTFYFVVLGGDDNASVPLLFDINMTGTSPTAGGAGIFSSAFLHGAGIGASICGGSIGCVNNYAFSGTQSTIVTAGQVQELQLSLDVHSRGPFGVPAASNASFSVYIDPAFADADKYRIEIGQFGGAVPEPATWAMFLLGFGGIGFMLRRARLRPVAAAARAA